MLLGWEGVLLNACPLQNFSLYPFLPVSATEDRKSRLHICGVNIYRENAIKNSFRHLDRREHLFFTIHIRLSVNVLSYQRALLRSRIVPYIANHVSGADERGRIIRRSLIRYLMISETLVFQAISPTVKARFPTLDHIVKAGETSSCDYLFKMMKGT